MWIKITFLFAIVLITLLSWLVFLFASRLKKVKKMEDNEKISESEMRFRLAFDYSPVGMALVSLEGHWLKVNKALRDMVGYTEEELLHSDFQTITHPDDLEQDLQNVKQLSEGKIKFYRMEKRYIRKDKKETWILLTVSLIRNEVGEPLYYIAQIQDINDKKKAEQELSFKAYFDNLTGLVNRNQLEHSLELATSSALRHRQHFAIFFIDIDHFKNINDSLGHDAGDEVLKIVSDRLRASIRKTDIAARLGGDEFILVLHGTDTVDTAAIFAEKILGTILEPMKIKEHELFISVSIGISFYPADGMDYPSLIKSADLALYKAKEQGRNNFQFCTPRMNQEIQERITFKNALQKAVDNEELYLTFLPRLNRHKNVTAFETLLRWESQKYGYVSPAKIIPLAEEIGIINQLSHWIIEKAIGNLSIWQKEHSVKVTINVSPRQYLQNEFLENIFEALRDAKLFPYFLELEINESLIMQDPDYSTKVIKTLKNQGVLIIIDNFGTGYSSLNYLSQFGVDYVKLARDYIRDINHNFQHRELVTAMIALAKTLNIKIIAEGIESQEQYDLLLKLGCDEFQGYYISEPLKSDRVLEFLTTHRTKTTMEI